MKKIIYSLFLLLLPLSLTAQEHISTVPTVHKVSFGYFSYDEVLHSMSAYTAAQRQLANLRSQYEAEQKRSEDEFNKKYEEFLDGQSTFAPNIRVKRQAELEELMKKSIDFKQQAEQLLQQAEKDALAPLHRRILEAAQTLGKEYGFDFILNSDNNALPFVSSTTGEDVTAKMKSILK
ncbi:MAG: OmpH family outer membrane protein [Prevotella sp.]|jgi:outer membrane protein